MNDIYSRQPNRRDLLAFGAAGSGLLVAGPVLALAPTELMTIGPFYPVLRPIDEDADLTMVNGMKISAKGDVIHMTGHVRDSQGRPIAGARIEIWQANAAGRYAHPADGSPIPLDDGFQGFGVQQTDANGRYAFKTIKPGAYKTPAGGTRTPHIHVDVQGRSTRTISQMFFPGEPLNEQDGLLMRARNPRSVIAKLAPPMSGGQFYDWDIMLDKG